MRLAWFTPLARHSAIARYSAVVVEALGRQADVMLLAPEDTTGDELPMPVPTLRFAEGKVAEALKRFDVAIFNMGDSPYHFGVWSALQEAHAALHPAVAVLHDRFYLHLLHDYAMRAGDPERIVRQLEAVHDRAEAARVLALLRSGAPLETLEPYPLAEPIRDSADAFIVHSRFCREKTGLDVDETLELFIPVEYATRGAPAGGTMDAHAAPSPRLTLLTVGVGNRNKCLHLVLDALAEDHALGQQVEYVAVGSIEPAYLAELRARAAAHRLDVDFRGYVDDAELAALLARADVCINLRRPCLEGGSASMVDMLAAGKPLIVFDDGVYAEIPDGCAMKLPLDSGARELAAAIRRLAEDPSERRRMGDAGRDFVHVAWTRDQYVERLLARLSAWHEGWRTWPGLRAAAARAGRELDAVGLPARSRIGREVAAHLGKWRR